ncbi:hypothetical protein JM18_007678 [Phytophthora kernoviae]|uniref:TPX2 C-terminal domain-containing protein n=2 Tax=Phytophthora kernoviae TaxID=325452 RepID=A0A921SBF1_9STRA|nr:hypothetical protein G195_007652 [Phytophthora kernoviae 00238/432]KAG2517276.1 hypothetical protein JM18_007678 [Phytophthora kernoviae]
MATLLDTTMETLDTEDVHDNNNQCHASPQTDTPEDEEDEDFQFNAPSYYDLKNPSLEQRYVNNADGYFSSPAPSNTTSRASPFEAAEASPSPEENRNNHALEENGDEQMEDTDKNMLDTTMVDEELSRSLLEDRPETFEEPTQSYLRRLQAEQYMREQTFMEDVPVEEKPHRVTKPRGPKLHSRARPMNPNDPSRMSSTSRELLKIQEERLHLQLEKLKIREFHEKTKAQRPPTNVHQRSIKQLTIPQSPHFKVDSRARRFHSSASESSVSSSVDSESGHEMARPPIAAETLLSRDYALPLPPHSRENRHALTTPHSPQLHTASRAAHRPPPAPTLREHEKPAAPDYSRAKVGGLTQPMTPQLETTRRAATHRRPVEVVDHDAEELAKKFHARPINKSILQPKSYRYSPAKSEGKARLTQPMAPKQSASARSVTRQSASERAASVSAELERHRKEREERLKVRQARQAGQSALQKTAPKSVPKSVPAARRGPVIPETPPLKSIQLHRQYQETFRRKVEAEEQKQEKQRQFRANPMRVTSTPAKFEGSSKPLTEVIPFQLPGERYHEKAQERLEKKRLEEAEQLKSAGTFRAKPMPVYESENHEGRGFHVKSNEKPLTHVVPPTLATDRRASERAAFNAAEKERRQQEEAFREQREAQQRQLKEEEIKHLRQEKMIFHARPVPEDKPPFQPKFDTKPLTEPISPISRS